MNLALVRAEGRSDLTGDLDVLPSLDHGNGDSGSMRRG